jgi:hypothetical protein
MPFARARSLPILTATFMGKQQIFGTPIAGNAQRRPFVRSGHLNCNGGSIDQTPALLILAA